MNGIDLHYELDGDGPDTIVLINGLADDLETWVLQMEDLLGAGYRVLRFDNRGVGKSSAPPGPYTSRMLADDAKALVDELGLTGFHLMGTSMGGMIAQEYAINHGADLASATLLEHLRRAGPVLLADVLDVARHGADERRPVHHARRDAVGLHRCRSSRSGRTS